MQNLLQFILRYSSFFTFIILETFCIYLLVTYNTSQREIYVHSSSLITGKVLNSVHEMKEYANLSEVNDSLARENARLRALMMSFHKDSIDAVIDSSDAYYKVIPAEVINNNILGRNNMITLDKGARDGLSPSMGLIDDVGIVGIIKDVSERYATAYSILNTSLRISAKISRNNHFGSLVWDASDIRYMNLRSIPQHVEVRMGDTVSTTEYSSIFPADVPVGVIEEFELTPGRNDFTIRVKLLNDLSRIDVVYAVKGEFWQEKKDLENEVIDE